MSEQENESVDVVDEPEQAAPTDEAVDQSAVRSYPRADFAPLDDESDAGGKSEVNLDVILDVPVSLSMEVGRVRIPIRNLLQLNQGSVVELDRAAGDPLDVFVNGTLVAHGEVVVVNERFGVRLIDVVSPSERVRNLR